MKPIIFSTENVKALLDGRKTMMRVVIKPRYGGNLEVHGDITGTPRLSERCGDRCRGLVPPHEVGDVLWVRETWGDYGGRTSYYVYRADYPHGAKGYWNEKEHINWCDFPKWRPSIFMPREAARIFLKVKDVRVERVQDITVDDAGREGFEGVDNFIKLWDTINTKPGLYKWKNNPFVWTICFERVGKDGKVREIESP